jgi:uncharacterized membrane protein
LADSSVIAVLTFLHIASAIGWLGGVVFFLSVLGPAVRTFSPAASLEFLTKVGPKQVRFFGGVATATIIFGLGLVFAAFGTDLSAWPWYIEVGMTMGLIAYLIAVLITIPTFRKADKLAHDIMTNAQGADPAALGALLKKGNMAAMAIAAILFLTLVFMVSSAVFA